MSLAYPKSLPKPTRRKGALIYEIRVRVPPEARGKRFKASHTTRSLGTRDKAEAARNLPKIYLGLQAEFEAEVRQSVSETPNARLLTVDEVCAIERDRLYKSEQQNRRERLSGFVGDPDQLAQEHRTRLQRRLKTARAKAVNRDFTDAEWLLTYLAKSGQGGVADHQRALGALARTKVKVLQEIIADDEALAFEITVQQEPGIPTLKEHASSYLGRRASELTGERSALIAAVVRDFIALSGGDKRVTAYTRSDAVAFIDALLCLPANWRKNRKLRHLEIAAAARAAKESGVSRQSAESIRKKVALIAAVFAEANDRYGGVTITFPTKGLPKAAAANEQRDPFTHEELAKLLSSDLPRHLKWLTRLSLYTGARLNELAQLTAKHIHNHGDLYHVRFDPDMRLKSPSCVRSVPIHPRLIEMGFIDYVSKCMGPLFPGITQHSSGRFSDALSKAFSRHLALIGIKRPKLSFHSLRHTFAERFKVVAPREAETRLRLLGQSVTGVAGRYGGGYKAEANDMELLAHRAKVLDGLNFKGLNAQVSSGLTDFSKSEVL